MDIKSSNETTTLSETQNTHRKFPERLPGSEYKWEFDWYYIVLIVTGHIGAIYSLWTPDKPLLTGIYTYLMNVICLFGVNVGTHRFFTHKAFKANAPLRILLVTLQTFSLQRSVYTWVHDHRLHHKYTETNGDPHNPRRGFFFAHVGWMMLKPHPDVVELGEVIDLSDLKSDPYVMFQYRYYVLLAFSTVIVSAFIPWYFWGENLTASLLLGVLFRYGFSLNVTWLVNSLAHSIGTRPYDKNFSASEYPIVSFFATGEGFHNYHHAFPWDYKTSETGKYSLNWSTAFIDFMAKLGWATDLKTASAELVRKRILRTGGTDVKKFFDKGKFKGKNEVWGWDDPEMLDEDKNLVLILNKTISKY